MTGGNDYYDKHNLEPLYKDTALVLCAWRLAPEISAEKYVEALERYESQTLERGFLAGFQRCDKGDRFGKSAEELFKEWREHDILDEKRV